MKIALAQFNPTVGDFPGNSARMIELAAEAKSRNADLVVFSELGLCGYPPQDLVERPSFVERNLKELKRLAASMPMPAIVGYVGKAQEHTGKLAANAAALLADGRIVFEQQKMLLPSYDVFDESRYFQPARSQSNFLFGGQQLGITICEDCWNDKQFWAQRLYDRDPVAELVGKGTTVLLNISASPYNLDKRGQRMDVLEALARHHKVPVVYVNQVGGNDSLVFDGSSVAFTAASDIRSQPKDELEAAYDALVCGTRDYVYKCGFRDVVIGLSGGIDSALVAAIAADALGPQNVLGVSMPGPYSSPGSLTDAKKLAGNLGIQYQVLPIHAIVESYRTALAG